VCRSANAIVQRSTAAHAAIDSNLVVLHKLVHPEGGHKGLQGIELYEALLQSCDKLRLKLLPRARALQMLASTGMVRCPPALACPGIVVRQRVSNPSIANARVQLPVVPAALCLTILDQMTTWKRAGG
jgi:hypothetical protein